MLTLEEAIEHAEDIAISAIGCECREEHKQLVAWLRELQETRKERDYWKEKAHSYEQTIFKLTDAISKQPEIIYCKDCENWDTTWDSAPNYHYCPIMDGTYSGDFYCAKAERRNDATN